MPLFVMNPDEPLVGVSLEGFDCDRLEYKKLKNIEPFEIEGEFIAYASPDSTYAVTKRLFDGAKREIMIGIYDFSADYVKELLLNARERGVRITLMLDINSEVERALFKKLEQFGCTTVPAPSCANKQVSYFPNCHEKFVVIDNEWVMVQSGNYSKHSIPINEEDGGDPEHFKKGNRDMGVAIQSKVLAAFFKKVLKRDIKLVTHEVSPESLQPEVKALPLLVDFVPEALPVELFPSKRFQPTKPIKVQPVLSPDNYMEEVIALLASAKKSIYIENQYIRSSQPEVSRLLGAVKGAMASNSDLDVRIILGKLFNADDGPKEKDNIKNLKQTFGLALGDNIRYIDTKRFVHCHNKLIIVDEKIVLISSQNWSDTAVSLNREAGLILYYPQMAKYYLKIFESDWSTALKKIPIPGASNTVRPEALFSGDFTEVSPADYEEV
jgi:phosphatidylserine/phosphatidylglycerophosphate/cardiolipin synthase-like enzyme